MYLSISPQGLSVVVHCLKIIFKKRSGRPTSPVGQPDHYLTISIKNTMQCNAIQYNGECFFLCNGISTAHRYIFHVRYVKYLGF